MLATAGHNEEEHGRKKLPAETPLIVTTRESNNKHSKLQQHTEKRERRKEMEKKRASARGKRERECERGSKCPKPPHPPRCRPRRHPTHYRVTLQVFV
jgi:hypothetical protein